MKISAVKERLASLLLITYGTLINALTPQPRADAICSYMPNEAKIYCYGGHRFDTNGTATTSFDQYFVSINLAQDWRVTDMPNGWEQITQDAGPNVDFAMVAVPNENIIFMHGGSLTSTVLTRYKAAYFNTADTVSGWKQVIPEQSGSRVTKQSAILGPDNSTIYIWGGMRNDYTGDMEPGDEQYPRMMYTLDVKNWQWGTGSVAAAGYTSAKPVLIGSSIYYLGGYTTASNIIRANPMDSLLIYNTDSGAWQAQSIGGSVVPSTRTRHTATLKPSTGEIILLGGASTGNTTQSRDDYFYILSTQGGNLEWSTRQLGGDFQAVGIIGHSAVLAGDYLFVLFGAVNIDNRSLTFIHADKIRVMDVNNWSWVTFINALSPEDITPGTNGNSDGSSTVNTGTIAGAAVGGVVGLAIIAAVSVFFLVRRRGKRRLEEERYKSSSHRMLPNEIEFDGDTAYATSKDQSHSSVVEVQPPIFYSPEKPDGSVSLSESEKTPPTLSTKKPVKPDGGWK